MAAQSATPEGPTVWIGWEVRGGVDPVEAAKAFEVHDRQSDESHYELIAVAARGFHPPHFLSAVETASDGVTDDTASTQLRQTWSVLYRRIAETSPPTVVPYAIYLLGVNPPPDTPPGELAVFNDFYTNVHLREVAERRHALRAVRYELVREIKAPHRGAPSFLAAYELDEEAASTRRHVGPPYSSGPDVWQRHTTPWRLWYRRLVEGR